MLSSLAASAQTSVDDYTNAVHRALALVQFAQRGDQPSVDQAIRVLQQAPGPAQPEIMRDLLSQPPNLSDAGRRLQALYDALQQHVDTPDPGRARDQLQSVMSMPRYTGLTSGPGLLERVATAVLGAIRRFLASLGVGNLQLNVPLWVWFVIGLLGTLFAILWPLRAGIGWRGRRARTPSTAVTTRPSLNFFARADQLAAAGDYAGAIRALAGGVAVRLNGERAWDQSPYTVRELFSRSKQADQLRPLLHLFEETSYGYRSPDRESYARAAEAASTFRSEAA